MLYSIVGKSLKKYNVVIHIIIADEITSLIVF
jgi:hypothetical protein